MTTTDPRSVDLAPLDDPFGSALRGRHSRFARVHGTAIAYQRDVSVFYAHPRELTDADFADLAALAGPGGTIGLRDRHGDVPADWELIETFDLVQYSGELIDTAPDPAFTWLGPSDVDDILELIELTKPGPFLPRTIELGVYLGLRNDDGTLVAMAGERAKPDGWTEISAVCTRPEARGQGLARRLIMAVAHGIVADGDLPFLHTTADNPACRLYEAMGFVHRSTVPLEIVRVPR